MFAVYADEPDPDAPLSAVVVGERPEPEITEGWVRVRPTAASLNMHDVWTLRGVVPSDARDEEAPMDVRRSIRRHGLGRRRPASTDNEGR